MRTTRFAPNDFVQWIDVVEYPPLLGSDKPCLFRGRVLSVDPVEAKVLVQVMEPPGRAMSYIVPEINVEPWQVF